MDKKAIGDRLKQLRKRNINPKTNKSFTQEDFAFKIGISPDSIKKIEQGHNVLTVDNAITIKEKFGVSLDWLYGVSEEMNDEISTTLIALRKYFKLCVKRNKYCKYFTATFSETLRDFLLEYDEAERICKEKNIPDSGREAWLNDIKARYNSKMQSNDLGKEIDYSFSEHVYKVEGAKVENPPTF